MRKMGIIVLFAGALSVNATLIGHFTATNGLVMADGKTQVKTWENQAVDDRVRDISVSKPNNAIYDSSWVMDSGRPGVRWDQAGRAPLFTGSARLDVLDFSTGRTGNNRGVTVIFAFEPLDLTADNTIFGVMGEVQQPNFKVAFDSEGTIQVMLNDPSNQTLIDGSTVQEGQTVVVGFTYSAQTGKLVYWDSLGEFSTKQLAENAIFSEDRLWFAGSANKKQEVDGIFGELRIYDEVLDETAFGSVCKDMVKRWAVPESGEVTKDKTIDSVAKTAPTPKPTPAPTLSEVGTSFVFGLIIIAPILLLLFRRS